MKKYFNLFAFALVALFFTTACSNDDDPAPVPQKKVVKEFCEFFVRGDDTILPSIKSSFNYLNGVFSSADIEAGSEEKKYNYSLFMKGDKIVGDDGDIVCQDMKFNADGFLTYVKTFNGTYTITYSGRHIVTCVMEDGGLTDGISVKEEDHLTWEGGKLVSVEATRTVGDEVLNSHITFTYSSVPNQHKQQVHCTMSFLGFLLSDLPGFETLGIFGDGADYAVTGYTIKTNGDELVRTIDLTFDADGYITSEMELSNSTSGLRGHGVTYKY